MFLRGTLRQGGGQHVLFLFGVALYGGDEIGDEGVLRVGARAKIKKQPHEPGEFSGGNGFSIRRPCDQLTMI
jgi:hypothetical protein